MFDLVRSVKVDEGLELMPYRDQDGNLTIGYGHNLSFGITPKEADNLLKIDLHTSMELLDKYLPWMMDVLPVTKYNALTELTFWIGMGGVKPPKGLLSFPLMLAALQRFDWDDAAKELLDSQLGRNFTKRTSKLAAVISGSSIALPRSAK